MSARIIPMGWPCDAAGAVSAYLDRGDREDKAAAAEASVALGLRVQFLAALAESKGDIPYVQRGQRGGPDTEQAEPLHDTVMDLLDYSVVNVLLLDVLAHSECTRVRALRVALADQLVRNRAGELAEVRAS